MADQMDYEASELLHRLLKKLTIQEIIKLCEGEFPGRTMVVKKLLAIAKIKKRIMDTAKKRDDKK
jgi:hypothetical protein